MTPGAALPESHRQIIIGGGVAFGALLCIVQPWQNIAAFVYPPHAKMLLSAFGAMPSGAAVAIWAALNLFCLFRAGELLNAGRNPVVLACLLPATLIMIATAYPAGFLALMATVVVTQGHSHPGRAGLCLALATVHPPFALLLLLLLLLFGYWRVVAITLPWTIALLAVSVITVGHDAWADYLAPAAAPTEYRDAA